VETSTVWKTNNRVRLKISVKDSIGYYELKKHKPWFNEGCSELLGLRKQTTLHWLQDPNEINGDKLNS
jgi:hypothetical protein